jgi:hypothetical protein
MNSLLAWQNKIAPDLLGAICFSWLLIKLPTCPTASPAR